MKTSIKGLVVALASVITFSMTGTSEAIDTDRIKSKFRRGSMAIDSVPQKKGARKVFRGRTARSIMKAGKITSSRPDFPTIPSSRPDPPIMPGGIMFKYYYAGKNLCSFVGGKATCKGYYIFRKEYGTDSVITVSSNSGRGLWEYISFGGDLHCQLSNGRILEPGVTQWMVSCSKLIPEGSSLLERHPSWSQY